MLASIARPVARAAYYRLQNRQLLRLAAKQANSFKVFPRQFRYNKLSWHRNAFALATGPSRPKFSKIALVSGLTAGVSAGTYVFFLQDNQYVDNNNEVRRKQELKMHLAVYKNYK